MRFLQMNYGERIMKSFDLDGIKDKPQEFISSKEALKDICPFFEIDDWGYCNWFIDYQKKSCKDNCHKEYDKVLEKINNE